MIVYIQAQTKVKAQTRNVYYVGNVQDDGYIYFNDEIMYRIPTPNPLQENQRVPINECQIWYTIRNCWIRANYFTNLTVFAIDLEALGGLEQRVTDLENKQTDILRYINTLGRTSLGDNSGNGGNGEVINALWTAVSQIISDVQTSATLPSGLSLWRTWNDVS